MSLAGTGRAVWYGFAYGDAYASVVGPHGAAAALGLRRPYAIKSTPTAITLSTVPRKALMATSAPDDTNLRAGEITPFLQALRVEVSSAESDDRSQLEL